MFVDVMFIPLFIGERYFAPFSALYKKKKYKLCIYWSIFLLCDLGLWSSPFIKGSRPPPCSSFSLTMTDEDQAVMFGGNTPSGESSEAYFLQLLTMVSYC